MLSGLIATWQALVIVEANGNEEFEARNRKHERWELRTKRHTLGSGRRAVASALEHAKVHAPRADGFAALVGHNPGDLVEMS